MWHSVMFKLFFFWAGLWLLFSGKCRQRIMIYLTQNKKGRIIAHNIYIYPIMMIFMHEILAYIEKDHNNDGDDDDDGVMIINTCIVVL